MVNNQNTDLIITMKASKQFQKYCDELDSKLESSLNEAFKEEFISAKRKQRIISRFCELLLK